MHTCDDDDTSPGDGCDGSCQIELGYDCTRTDSSTADVCIENCGDGITVGSTWACDDGDTDDVNGCSNACGIVDGWECSGGDSTTASSCNEVCGDGYLHVTDPNTRVHTCDDDDTSPGDGCDGSC